MRGRGREERGRIASRYKLIIGSFEKTRSEKNEVKTNFREARWRRRVSAAVKGFPCGKLLTTVRSGRKRQRFGELFSPSKKKKKPSESARKVSPTQMGMRWERLTRAGFTLVKVDCVTR